MKDTKLKNVCHSVVDGTFYFFIYDSLKQLFPGVHARNFGVSIIKYLHMIHEICVQHVEFDKENPPRHQVSALIDELCREAWKVRGHLLMF